ncbi:hypothetical protein GUJ93_ZPchr0003g16786 [Zizania palustris]|uniref:Hyaluronan/mRNA-binding protein domain-containing protein n=1 Tax=Zizania palustris TaxID=103762 RepID=A0A8J5S1D8_ZIZPA|nr:hypothetical protein GUJ93_ZPchr0003g16786 [Zizania palustris]
MAHARPRLPAALYNGATRPLHKPSTTSDLAITIYKLTTTPVIDLPSPPRGFWRQNPSPAGTASAMSNPFALLGLVDGESDEEVIVAVVGKKKAQAAAAAANLHHHNHQSHYGMCGFSVLISPVAGIWDSDRMVRNLPKFTHFVNQHQRGLENGRRGRGYHNHIYNGNGHGGYEQGYHVNNHHQQGYHITMNMTSIRRRITIMVRDKFTVVDSQGGVTCSTGLRRSRHLKLLLFLLMVRINLRRTWSQEHAAAGGADAKPASASEESTKDGESERAGKINSPKGLSGSAKKKWKKQNLKGGVSKVKKAGNEPEGTEQDMTLEEYEKVLEEKRKALEALKSEGRKVTAEEFEGMKMLEKKKVDDDGYNNGGYHEHRGGYRGRGYQQVGYNGNGNVRFQQEHSLNSGNGGHHQQHGGRGGYSGNGGYRRGGYRGNGRARGYHDNRLPLLSSSNFPELVGAQQHRRWSPRRRLQLHRPSLRHG